MHDFRNSPDPEFPDEYEETDIFGPGPEPPTVLAGNYLCQFSGAVLKRTSQWGGFYYEMPLKIKDATGRNFEYKFSFSNPRNQVYAAMMLLAGGKELPNRAIELPPKNDIIGKLFQAQILERPMKNDNTKLANEIFKVWAYVPKKKTETEPEPGAQVEAKNPDEKTVPVEKEFPKSKEEEEMPF